MDEKAYLERNKGIGMENVIVIFVDKLMMDT